MMKMFPYLYIFLQFLNAFLDHHRSAYRSQLIVRTGSSEPTIDASQNLTLRSQSCLDTAIILMSRLLALQQTSSRIAAEWLKSWQVSLLVNFFFMYRRLTLYTVKGCRNEDQSVGRFLLILGLLGTRCGLVFARPMCSTPTFKYLYYTTRTGGWLTRKKMWRMDGNRRVSRFTRRLEDVLVRWCEVCQ